MFSDKGLEFTAHAVKDQLKLWTIQQSVAQNPDVKAGIAERFIRTVKGRLYKFFTAEKTTRWIDVLPELVDMLNRSKTRATGMRPIDVTFENADAVCTFLVFSIFHYFFQFQVWEKVYGKEVREKWVTQRDPKLQPKHEVGETVRISKEKKAFDKGYLPQFSDEVYVVDKVTNFHPTTYRLKTKDGRPIQGTFYPQELSRTKFERDHRLVVEDVLKTRKRRGVTEYFVKWQNRPMEEATWISDHDLEE